MAWRAEGSRSKTTKGEGIGVVLIIRLTNVVVVVVPKVVDFDNEETTGQKSN